MAEDNIRDHITVQDNEGNARDFWVEALFDMNEQTYALLNSVDNMVLMRVVDGEGDEQYLEGIEDPEEADAILDAYQLAIDAAPAE
ncbi:DUF1292 domain-containing protein [Paenibacillus xerothermodurans]|uniref:DUF1292 domain-containing protein n=1 Tax=Paenibacillus xerothermodurans TaxID=1977292 RepID=A0A2W1N7K3_PAEXE|nr:DUF1292 domain-containing protein [Paenibacillus xerothermodurans]PZE20387.1 DUF1292 domain-containing protein [Paenibacillus xerothermodurans]